MESSFTYTGISHRSHSNAESIFHLYKNSTKNKISKIVDAEAKIDDETKRDPYSLVSLDQALHLNNIS